MVEGNAAIRMSTSVLDYVFRELGITYLDRTELAHVEVAAHSDHHAIGAGRYELDPLKHEPARRAVASIMPPRSGGSAAVLSPAEQALLAGDQGYHCDSCPDCGHFTIVRNSTCLKCESCGATSGRSEEHT